MMAVGLSEPAAASTPIIVAGMSCTPEVVTAMSVTMALLAVSLSGLSVCSSSIALMPSGVAALLRPSMLAARASTIAPAAGWSGGTSGKSQRRSGRSARPTSVDEPGGLGDAHHAQPERHDADEADRDLHGGRRGVDGALRHRVGRAVDRRDERARPPSGRTRCS